MTGAMSADWLKEVIITLYLQVIGGKAGGVDVIKTAGYMALQN